MAQGFEGGAFRADLTAVTSATQALALANPEGRDIYVTRFLIATSAPSAGAATVDAGIAADAVTSSDTLIDGASVASSAKVIDSGKDGGTNGKIGQKWGASQFLTVTASATLAGLVGEVIIEWVPL